MAMTIGELQSIIDEMLENGYDEGMEVRIAMQPNWPFEYSLSSNYSIHEDKLYLSEGRQLNYLPGEVKNELGW